MLWKDICAQRHVAAKEGRCWGEWDIDSESDPEFSDHETESEADLLNLIDATIATLPAIETRLADRTGSQN